MDGFTGVGLREKVMGGFRATVPVVVIVEDDDPTWYYIPIQMRERLHGGTVPIPVRTKNRNRPPSYCSRVCSNRPGRMCTWGAPDRRIASRAKRSVARSL